MMKFNKLLITCCLLLFAFFCLFAPKASLAYDYSFSKKWAGRILLQTEENGEAWYINPVNLKRYYLGRPDDAFQIMLDLGLGISNADLGRLPDDEVLLKRLLGRILLQVEQNGEAWYVDPIEQRALFLGAPKDAFKLMKEKVHGISNENLEKIKIYKKEDEKFYAKGLYLTGYSAGNPEKRRAMIDLIDSTELNSVVIDIKDATGYVLYNSAVPFVNEIDGKRVLIKDLKSVFKQFKDNDVYVIARQVVFLDPVLAAKKPELAIEKEGGGLWEDYGGKTWVDPTRKEVWDYNIAIAKEAVSLGADEINFDYVRFPSDGPVETAVYHNLAGVKAEAMKSFFEYLGTELGGVEAKVSVDFFGLTLDNAKNGFDLNIGQRLIDAADFVDYICPMTYPSHYADGYLGFENPAEHPYEVVKRGLDMAREIMADRRAGLRVWIQAFDLGAVYDGDKIRAQIKAVEENNEASGWLLWNARNSYTDKGLLSA